MARDIGKGKKARKGTFPKFLFYFIWRRDKQKKWNKIKFWKYKKIRKPFCVLYAINRIVTTATWDLPSIFTFLRDYTWSFSNFPQSDNFVLLFVSCLKKVVAWKKVLKLTHIYTGCVYKIFTIIIIIYGSSNNCKVRVPWKRIELISTENSYGNYIFFITSTFSSVWCMNIWFFWIFFFLHSLRTFLEIIFIPVSIFFSLSLLYSYYP